VQEMEVGPPEPAVRGRLKPPQAATVKSRGGERCGNAGTRYRQAWSREDRCRSVESGLSDVRTGG
jgi:hypothetical protein